MRDGAAYVWPREQPACRLAEVPAGRLGLGAVPDGQFPHNFVDGNQRPCLVAPAFRTALRQAGRTTTVSAAIVGRCGNGAGTS